jgi:CheY-like chemotaxis protein
MQTLQTSGPASHRVHHSTDALRLLLTGRRALPVVANPAPARAPEIPPAPPSIDASLPPILVADDDPDDVFFVQRLIRKTGVRNRVLTFDDGSEVVNFLGSLARAASSGKHEPLLLFLDLRMAGLGGFGFLEWARQQKQITPLKIVVLSNSNEPDDVTRALALGAHRYLVKYPSLQTFTTIVRSVYPATVF